MFHIMLIITFSQFIDSLIMIAYLAVSVVMSMILWDILKWFFGCLKGLLAPIVGHRAYFHRYQDDIFYSESWLKFLFFKLPRNKKWALHYSKVGYVKRPFWRPVKDNAALVFTRSHRERGAVAESCFIHDTTNNIKKAEIHLREFMPDGSSRTEYSAVGYVDEKGDIYKYYKDYEHAKNRNKLSNAEKIGSCRYLIKDGRDEFKTHNEKQDEDVLPYIENDIPKINEAEAEYCLRSSWFSFRINRPKKSIVKAIKIDSTRIKCFRRWIDLKIWNCIHVIPLGWDFEPKAYGYGFVKQNHHLWKDSSINEIPLAYEAGAALLLLEEQGFYRYENETLMDEKLGWAETALVALIAFLACYYSLLKIPFFKTLFPFMGAELSMLTCMMLSYVGIWGLLHLTLNTLLDRPYSIVSVLNMLNSNTGSLFYLDMSITLSVIGLIVTIFYFPFALAPFFLAIIISLSVNRANYPQQKWPVVDPFADDDVVPVTEDDSVIENAIERTYEWSFASSFTTAKFKATMKFDPVIIEELRRENPFNNGKVSADYVTTVKEMLASELTGKIDTLKSGIKLNPSLKTVFNIIESELSKRKLPEIERIQARLDFVQDAISYKNDTESEPLKTAGICSEYCRYSRETLFDQEGDCDCKSELLAVLFLQAGYRVAYCVTDSHAFVGLSKNSLNSMKNYCSSAFGQIKGEYFLYCESTGENWRVGQKPNDFETSIIQDAVILDPKDYIS